MRVVSRELSRLPKDEEIEPVDRLSLMPRRVGLVSPARARTAGRCSPRPSAQGLCGTMMRTGSEGGPTPWELMARTRYS